MTDQLIRAWVLATDPDFGGSLDYEPDTLRTVGAKRTPASGVPYCYRIPGGWQVRIPGVKTRKFEIDALDQARAFVALHVELA